MSKNAVETILVRWSDQTDLHFTQSVNHGVTACGLTIPLNEIAPEYAEVKVFELTNFKGLCKKCFHEMCIDFQYVALWEIYYAHIAPPNA